MAVKGIVVRLARKSSVPYVAVRELVGRVLENRVLPYVVSSVIIFLLLMPIIFMMFTSFKSTKEVFRSPPTYLPHQPTLEAYKRALLQSPLSRGLLNSLVISLGTTAIAIFLAIPTAYGLIHYRFKGAGLLPLILLLTRIIPPVSLIIPFFILLTRIELVDTYAGLILLNVFLSYPLAVWMLRPFFEAFPRELLWAALVDGCSRTRAFLAIVLPVVSTGIAAVAIIVFLWTWNEFLFALVFSNSKAVQPVTVALRFFIGDEFVEWNAMAGASLLASLPGIVLFLSARRVIVEGLTGALKG